MMDIIGIGADIEEVQRFKDKPYLDNQLFYKKIFTIEEIEQCLIKPSPEQSFAARFAAKEAIIKSSNKRLWFTDIVIGQDQNRRPVVRINNPQKLNAEVSFSHTKTHALAMALVWQLN
ncbi:MAG TPA: holo-ACP synthase [Candidatus Nanoarchaeia archaeon]|nr:holo-ACP synthase [Candidatus Nanoarchaeia archaeon]